MNTMKGCLVIVALVCCIATVFAITPYNHTDYCGVPPYPEPVPDLPLIKSSLSIYKPQLTDAYIAMRHGDRATGTLTCFQNSPGFAHKNWTICEDPTTAWHTALDDREHRSVQYDIPFSPLMDKQGLVGNCHYGQLSKKGALQAYNQGRRVARFLEESYSSNNRVGKAPKITEENFELRSTDVPRTRETMVSFVAGAFDELKHVKKNPKNMPIVGFVDEDFDALQNNKNMCNDAAETYLRGVYLNQSYIDFRAARIVPLHAELRALLNDPTVEINSFFDCVKTFKCQGWPMPPGMEDGGYSLAERVHNDMFWFWRHAFNHNHTQAAQLLTGPLLVELSQKFAKSALKTASDEPTISVMTAHDLGMMFNLVAALLNGEHFYWPPYASMLQIEFYKTQFAINGVTSFIRFVWQGQVVTPHFCTNDMVDDELCPTHVLLNYMKTLFPTKEQCPTFPRYDWPSIRDEFMSTSQMTQAAEQQPALASSINDVFTTIVDKLYDAQTDAAVPSFRTLAQDTDENGDITFEGMLKAFDGVFS
eukprot:UN02900